MTTAHAAVAKRVPYQLETLWDFDYEPTHHELESLYETAKKNQWNASTTNFFSRLTPEEQKEVEVRVSAWRLSQFLHGEQGALLVCGQLVNSIPELDAKLYASYGRDERTGFQSIKTVWHEMGWNGGKIWRDTIANSQTTKVFNRLLFTEVLMPRLQRLGLVSPRVEPRYREIGLLPRPPGRPQPGVAFRRRLLL